MIEMKLCNYIGLKEKDIISIVGAGGKTSFLFKLAKELKQNNYKVLVTTTTKIYVPPKEDYDFACLKEEQFFKYASMKSPGIYVYGMGVNLENKIIGIEENILNELMPYFDYILIEADGAKEKGIKGWNQFEPVISKKTTKTIGILDIQTIGMEICKENVHRSKIFCGITQAQEGESIKIEHLSRLISHQQGLFKGAVGEKILFINKIEHPYYLGITKQLIQKVNKQSQNLLDRTFIGSLKNNIYFHEIDNVFI